MRPMTRDQFSELVGHIYDCAVEPERWLGTIGQICEAFRCVAGTLNVMEPPQSFRFVRIWGEAPEWSQRFLDHHVAEGMALQHPAMVAQRIDEPYVLSRDVDQKLFRASRLYREWAKPLGYCDNFGTMLLRDRSRFAFVQLARHESVGTVGASEIADLRRLAPHIRRAVTISDLIEFTALSAAALDAFRVGVAFVSQGGRLLHANPAAQRMLDSGKHVRSIGGRLAATASRSNQLLSDALARAGNDGDALGPAGIDLALTEPGQQPVIAHVLPMQPGELRPRFVPQAVAAVFINQAATASSASMSAAAQAFGLTAAETRLLSELVQGRSLGAAALALKIANTTAKTQLASIFRKADVTRQADLLVLLSRFASPLA